ncbi:MAG: ATP-dependent DNA helicase RecG [Oscillospiraceae bacterium]|jgi:ATP-dependent DNA helicase RecG|nr:ATP-dependent DNA helicase RecG [Oscillospiraceae bacterium]
MASLFSKDLDKLRGIGKNYKEIFLKLGIETVGDLLYFFPRTYQDLSNVFSIKDAPTDVLCLVRAKVCSDVIELKTSSGRIMQKVKVCDKSSILNLSFFGSSFISKVLKNNAEFLFFGKIKNIFGNLVMVSPEYFKPTVPLYLRPVYNQTAGITSKRIEAFMKQSLDLLPKTIGEPIPITIRETFNLTSLGFAIKNIHFPQKTANITSSRRYFAFEQMLTFQLKITKFLLKNKKNNFVIENDFTSKFFKILPFNPTNAQKRCIDESLNDMKIKNFSMRRLLQGDVGSGKTVVALALCYNTAKNGFQSAIMVPTEILAKQHFVFFRKILSKENISVEMLTRSTAAKAKKEILDRLKNCEIDILVGTHAMLSDKVIFKKLGIVITDEQHRFGVLQREKLLDKGENPHMLIMSATPIPRTLALVFYGDLSISRLDELPAGRQKVDTFLIRSKKRKDAFNFVKNLIKNGHQGYIVCPLIEEDDTDLISVNEYFKILKNEAFSEYNIALLHGKMRESQKNDVMNKFYLGGIDVLISTTVVEVGVDVPNAVFIVVENSERFGLSTLHQLRGRVGRADVKSYCILVSDTQNETSLKRLKTLKNIFDGFKLADEDLKSRGPGEFLGTRQHGFSGLGAINFCDGMKILKQAQSAAREILKEDPVLEKPHHRYLKFKVENLEKSGVLP